MTYRILLTGLMALSLGACNRPEAPAEPPLFQLLKKSETGLDFENVLRQSSEFNVFNYMYFYNGGGVGAGDFNNDGLVDLYFTSNMGPNKMFLNQGNLKFRDITDPAGVAGAEGWTTGISIVDINNDGLLDLYVGQLGEYQSIRGKNQLFVCQEIRDGIPRYTDEAARYGLDLIGFSTQATFFDYDLDGDLDVFQLNHSLHQNGTFGPRKNFEGKPHPLAGDRLLRNDSRDGNPFFTDVTTAANIINTSLGYGLGIATGDLNNDGWPDLYIGNDFHENDYLYLNNRDGTFTESATSAMMHTSQFSMGVDMADVNLDGWADILSLDMLPEDPQILKSSLGEDAYNIFQYKIGLGYAHQYTRNCLQLNSPPQPPRRGGEARPPSPIWRRAGGEARLPPTGGAGGGCSFREIGLFSGIAATDWSWSPLFMDYDNDGHKDLFVSNGVPRRMNDIDYVKFRETLPMALKGDSRDVQEHELSAVDSMPKVRLPNKFYHNTGRLRFNDVSDRVSNSLPTFSNGAIYADLDNDGDLDVVTNNIEDEPFIYKNLSRESSGAASSFLSFQFKGQPLNRHGIGAKILIFKKNSERWAEEFWPVRGYQSSAHVPLHVGVGDPTSLDSVLVVWPDRTWERVSDLKFNTTQTLTWRPGLPHFDFEKFGRRPAAPYAFEDATAATGLGFQHRENPFVEFNREPLMPNMVSTEGPALAVGDINGDGLDDVFFGSAKRERSALYLQTKAGKLVEKTPAAILQDSVFEDVDAVFADLEGDGDLDLIIAAGGNEYLGQEEPMQQRAYINDGRGNFSRANPFPSLFMTASCVAAADFDGDGLTDFFFGGRAIPWKYGLTPKSYLMRNLGGGRFEDVTQSLTSGLQEVGLVKNATWADLDGDRDLDLLLAMEWEALTIFVNQEGKKFEKKSLPSGRGWWNFALPFDADGDGDLDIVAGNTGRNSRLSPTPSQPIRLYVSDFDNNGQTESVLTYYLRGKQITFANHEEMLKSLPMLKKKYLHAKNFSRADVPQIFGEAALAKAVLREADTFESIFLENTGQGYVAHALPDELQFSTLNAALPSDLNGDGKQELLLGGNFYDCNIEMGRYDASFGHVLRIGQGGTMEVFPLGDLEVRGQTRRIRQVRLSNGTGFIFARNNMAAKVLRGER